MEKLSTEAALLLMLLALGLALAVVLGLLFLREVRRIRFRHADAKVGGDEDVLMEFMVNRNATVLRPVRNNPALRGRMLRLAAPIQGEAKAALANAYVALGFAFDDFHTLRGRRLSLMTQALQRCRTIGLSLPESIWTRLLAHPNVTLRWGAMEYLIFTRGKQSFLWLMWFLRQPQNRRRGMALHLSTCFAKEAPSLLPRIIDHVDDQFLKEIWLHALSVYPVPGSEHALLDLATTLERTPLLTAAIKAVAALPSDETLAFLMRHVRNRDGLVRHTIAAALQAFFEPGAVQVLEMLSLDASFEIRAQAVDSLLAIEPLSTPLLDDIAAVADHPSHLLVTRARIGGAA